MDKRVAAFILVGMGLVPGRRRQQEAAPPTTTPAPVPAPAPTQQPTGLGTDAAMDLLAYGLLQRHDASLRRPLRPVTGRFDLRDLRRHLRRTATDRDRLVLRRRVHRHRRRPTDNADDGTASEPQRRAPGRQPGADHVDLRPSHGRAGDGRDGGNSAPQAVQNAATQEGITPQQWITNTLNNRHIGVGTADETILLMDPYEDEGEGDDPPLTPWGLIMGKMFSCADHSSGMPDEVFHDYMLYPEGEATYGPWTMTWFLEPIEEGGEEHAFVRFRSTAAQTPTLPFSTSSRTAPATLRSGRRDRRDVGSRGGSSRRRAAPQRAFRRGLDRVGSAAAWLAVGVDESNFVAITTSPRCGASASPTSASLVSGP